MSEFENEIDVKIDEDIDNDIGIDIDDQVDLSDISYEDKELKPKILVFGVGGGGVNAVNSMADDNFKDVDFVVTNTDAQSLTMSPIKKKILLGNNTTRGLGAGSDPIIGKNAAEESIDKIEKVLTGVNMLFLTAGMGGGTGTGAISVIAKKAKEMGILVAAIVTKPFDSEGINRMNSADDGIRELKKYVDTLIVVPNENLFRVANQNTALKDAYKMVDNVLKSGVKGITDLITKPGTVNLDFADVRTVMSKSGRAVMGTGEASGADKIQRAVNDAMSNPLLDNVSIKGAKGIIINITSSTDITLFDHNEIISKIKEELNNEYADIKFGNVFDDTLEDTIRVSIFATGIEDSVDNKQFEKNNIEFGEDIYKEENINDINNKEYIFNNDLNLKNQSRKTYNTNKVGESIKDNDEDIDIDDDFFDIGETIEYDDFSKNINQKTINQQNIEYDNIDTDLVIERNNIKNIDNYNNKKRLLQQDNNYYINDKQHKKQGFFSSLFNKNTKDNINKNDILQDDDENDNFDINIDYYNNTPTYLRKNKN